LHATGEHLECALRADRESIDVELPTTGGHLECALRADRESIDVADTPCLVRVVMRLGGANWAHESCEPRPEEQAE
jgi:hypothetical protein